MELRGADWRLEKGRVDWSLETDLVGVNWSNVAWGKGSGCAVVSTVTNIRVS